MNQVHSLSTSHRTSPVSIAVFWAFVGIPALVTSFVRQLSHQLGVPPQQPDAALLKSMKAYNWPGNVRELRNLVERWLILGSIPAMQESGAVADADDDTGDISLEAVEKRHILKVLAESGGNKTEAGRRLGVSRKTLERKCAEWGI